MRSLGGRLLQHLNEVLDEGQWGRKEAVRVKESRAAAKVLEIGVLSRILKLYLRMYLRAWTGTV